MSKRGLKRRVEGREPNDLCPCHSGRKYKHCHGKGIKGTGKYPRESANKKEKRDREETINNVTAQLRFEMMRRLADDLRR